MEIPKINMRIKELVDYYSNGSVRKFADMLPNISQQRLNRLFNIDTRTGKYPVATTDIITDITEMFVEVNANWLLTGEGSMFNNKTDRSFPKDNVNMGNEYSWEPKHLYAAEAGSRYDSSQLLREKDELIKEKDRLLKEKDRQLREKEAMINDMFEILKKMMEKQ